MAYSPNRPWQIIHTGHGKHTTHTGYTHVQGALGKVRKAMPEELAPCWDVLYIVDPRPFIDPY